MPSYCCYSSISDPSKEKMDKIGHNKLAENAIRIVDYNSHCIHALEAVPKPNGGITDCSQPSGIRFAVHY